MARWHRHRWLVGALIATFAVLGALVVAASAASASDDHPASNETAVLPPAQLSPPARLSPPVEVSPPVAPPPPVVECFFEEVLIVPEPVSPPAGLSPPAPLSPRTELVEVCLALPPTGSAGADNSHWLRIVILSAAGLAVLMTLAGAALELRREG